VAFLFLNIWLYLHYVKISFKKSLYIFSLYLAIIGAGFIFFRKTEHHYFPSENTLKIDFYTDNADNGNSEILTQTNTTDEIGISYILKPNFISPYCGFKIHFQEPIDLSSYSEISFHIDGTPDNFVRVYLLSEDENVLNKNHPLALRHNQIDLKINPKTNSNIVKLSEFETPFWWFDIIKQSKLDFKTPTFDKTHALAFSSGNQNAKNQLLFFKIKKITFQKDRSSYFLGLVCLGSLLLLLSYLLNIKKKKEVLEIKYQPVSISETNKQKSFLEYISQHYADSELSLDKIAQETGVNARTISESISEKYNCNFKTYINQIRITEAKRLMIESNMTLSEIAYQVGFNSPANFTRVFKNLCEESPTEFLQKHKK